MAARATARDILRSRDVWASRPTAAAAPVDKLCWHCCHPYDGPGVSLPVRHDDRRKVFSVVGQFCGWPCVKGYNRDSYTNLKSSLNEVTISHYAATVTGRRQRIAPAPPRQALRAFGGHMDLDEFRAVGDAVGEAVGGTTDNKKHVATVRLPVFFLGPAAYAGKAHDESTAFRRRAVAPQGPVDFADVACPSDTLRLRRPIPLSVGQNKLERALGLNALM